jgi:hypothetical protein
MRKSSDDEVPQSFKVEATPHAAWLQKSKNHPFLREDKPCTLRLEETPSSTANSDRQVKVTFTRSTII